MLQLVSEHGSHWLYGDVVVCIVDGHGVVLDEVVVIVKGMLQKVPVNPGLHTH